MPLYIHSYVYSLLCILKYYRIKNKWHSYLLISMHMLGIVVINYKSDSLTINYVKNELSKIKCPRVIIIVNNAGTKDSDSLLCRELSAELVKDIDAFNFANSNTYIISSKNNLGFAKGNNLAVRFLQSHFSLKYLLFSNNDIQIVDSDVCERLIEKIECNDNIGIIGPKVVGIDGKYQSPEPYVPIADYFCWMYLATPFMSNKKKCKRFKLDYKENAQEGFHYKVMGSFFLLRMADYVACGMMDENTFLYGEEVILTERLRSINKKVYYYPEVCVIHAHGVTTKRYLGRKGINKYLIESMLYYYQEYIKEPKWKCLLCKWIHILISWAK